VRTDARICDVCGTMYLIKYGCTLCTPNIRQEGKTKRQKPKDEPVTGGAAAVVVAPVSTKQFQFNF
jgi:hypothetical protein